MAKPSKSNVDEEKAVSLSPGDTVQWYNNGWRFGILLKRGPKWATILHMMKRKHVPIKDVEGYHG